MERGVPWASWLSSGHHPPGNLWLSQGLGEAGVGVGRDGEGGGASRRLREGQSDC